MPKNENFIIVIPAISSTRLPGKPLKHFGTANDNTNQLSSLK